MNMIIFLASLIYSCYFIDVHGHASYMSSSYCNTKLTVGTNIMGSSVKTSTLRTVSVLRNNVVVPSGSTYVPGESLKVTISSASNEWVYQTDTGKFSGGGCTGNVRISNSAGATLIAPSTGALNVFAAWATGQSTVYLTNTVSLQPGSKITTIPTLIPTLTPTNGPTTAPTFLPSQIPTQVPTAFPTLVPTPTPTNAPVTSKPTIIGQTNPPTSLPTTSNPTVNPTSSSPTLTPTVNPTSGPTSNCPTVKPTFYPTLVPTSHNPTLVPTTNPTDVSANVNANAASSGPFANSATTGLVFGLGTVGFLGATFYTVLLLYKNGLLVKFTTERQVTFFTIFGSSLGLISMAMVANWAQNKNTSLQFGYLGIPSWATNPLAWHVILMVGGFYVVQLLAISAWALIPVRLIAKKIHIGLQTIGLICMFIGLAAIIKHQNKIQSNNLTTMHSWYGVMAISMYSFNYLWGFSMAMLTQFYPNNMIKDMIPLKSYHQIIGLIALCLCFNAIITGINNQLGQGQCSYTNPPPIQFTDVNPAQNYSNLPNACKLGNGLGIVIFLSFLFISLSVYIRNHHMNKAELPIIKLLDNNETDSNGEPEYEFQMDILVHKSKNKFEVIHEREFEHEHEHEGNSFNNDLSKISNKKVNETASSDYVKTKPNNHKKLNSSEYK